MIKRYDVVSGDGVIDVVRIPCNEGAWCKWEDVEQLEADNERLRGIINRCWTSPANRVFSILAEAAVKEDKSGQ